MDEFYILNNHNNIILNVLDEEDEENINIIGILIFG